MGRFRVVAAVIRRDGRLLLCRRPPEKRHGGEWEFPGGKVLADESILSAAQRELSEELGVSVRGVKSSATVGIPDPDSRYTVEFVPVQVEGEPEPREHTELAWVREQDLLDYDLAPPDEIYVRHHLPGGPGREPPGPRGGSRPDREASEPSPSADQE